MNVAVLEDIGITLGPDETAPDAAVLGMAVAAGVVFDLAVRSGFTVLAGSLLVVVLASEPAVTGRLRNQQAQGLLAVAAVFGLFLSVRAAPWLVAVDVAVCAGLLVMGASFARGGSVLDVRAVDLLARGFEAVAHGAAAPGFLARAAETRRVRAMPKTAAVVRGALVAVPVVLVLGLLLASADAVFASFFSFSFDAGSLLAHAVLIAAGAWGAGGLLRLASSASGVAPDAHVARFGAVETGVVLGSLVALYTAFAVAQVVAVSEGGRRVLETAGLTYAEYARSGFFQLLAVGVLTLLTLTVLRSSITAGPRPLTLLAGASVLLTLVVVGVAVRRLHLYEQAFGLTVARLLAVLFAVWVGAVFTLLGASLAGVARDRSWLAAGSVGTGVALLFVVNVMNPEAVVVRRNLAHAERTGKFDSSYLHDLSEDAVPTLVDGLDRVPAEERTATLDAICNPYTKATPGEGWAAWNRSVHRAEAARARVC